MIGPEFILSVPEAASSRWRLLKKLSDKLARIEAARAASQARAQDLKSEQGQAKQRDRERLADALGNGRSEPKEREAEKVAASLEQEERRCDALALSVDCARAEIASAVEAHRMRWGIGQARSVKAASDRYRAAIVELEEARQALATEQGLHVWLRDFALGHAFVVPSTDALAGRISDALGAVPLGFNRVVTELNADLEHLSQRAGDPTPPLRLALELMRKGG